MNILINNPVEIEKESMRIIEGELRNSPSFHMERYSETELSVIRRIIHASADFEFAKNIRFVGDIAGVLSGFEQGKARADEEKESGELPAFGQGEDRGTGGKAAGMNQASGQGEDRMKEKSGKGYVSIPDSVGDGILHEAGMRSERRTRTVVSDTNMILAGISKPALSRLSMEAICFMGEPEIAKTAKERGITRAAASVEKAVSLYSEGIYLIGNAPTALIRLCELIEEGKVRPSLVIGVPVGFVNVVESKEYALSVFSEHGIPAILSMGRKGGSTIAVAAMNALMYSV